MKILLVDADESLTALIAYSLRRYGHQAMIAVDGDEAWRRWSRDDPDLILFDPEVFGEDHLELPRRVREVSPVPIVALSPRARDADFVQAFESGVDDYIIKPFSIRQLMARIHAVVSRSSRERPNADAKSFQPSVPVEFADLRLDTSLFEAQKNGRGLGLTLLELRILSCLATNAGRLVDIQRLSEATGRSLAQGDAQVVKTHISHIRGKLAAAGGEVLEICAIPRMGYILAAAGEREDVTCPDDETDKTLDIRAETRYLAPLALSHR